MKVKPTKEKTLHQLVSIVLPTYHRSMMLSKCVESVLRQTHSLWELIIIDDSTNREGNRPPESCNSDSRIKYYLNPTKVGLPMSRNIGIREAKGNYILFVEDDVILAPDCAEILMATFDKLCKEGKKVGAIAPSRPWVHEKNSASSTASNVFGKSGKKLGVPVKQSNLTGMIFHDFSERFRFQEVSDVHPCSLYLRKAIQEAGFFDDKTYKGNFAYEDSDLNQRIRLGGYKFYFQPSAVMYHLRVERGGCRIDLLRYVFFFLLNHCKFVVKNFKLKAFYMIPSFFVFLCLRIAFGAMCRIRTL